MALSRLWTNKCIVGAPKDEEKEEAFDKVEKAVTEYEGEDPKTFK